MIYRRSYMSINAKINPVHFNLCPQIDNFTSSDNLHFRHKLSAQISVYGTFTGFHMTIPSLRLISARLTAQGNTCSAGISSKTGSPCSSDSSFMTLVAGATFLAFFLALVSVSSSFFQESVALAWL